jgi:peroxiredoxin
MPRPPAIVAILLIVIASACDRGESEEDPWAAGARAPGSAPRTDGFGESDFGGPQRQHDEQRDGGPPDRSSPDSMGPEDCSDGLDNDSNGKVDCEDHDCARDPSCVDAPVGVADPEELAAVAKLPEGTKVGMRAPDFRLPLLGRKGTEALSDLRGHVVVLNFWASWCAPCRKEVPALELTWQLYRDKHVVVMGVSIDENKSDAEDFLGTFPVSYSMLHDREGEDAAKKWQVNSVPTLILIDAAGRIRERHQGYSPRLLRKTVIALDELLKE